MRSSSIHLRAMPHSIRDYFVYAPSQWVAMLQCNDVSYWLRAYTKWPREMLQLSVIQTIFNIHPRTISQEMLQLSIITMSLKLSNERPIFWSCMNVIPMDFPKLSSIFAHKFHSARFTTEHLSLSESPLQSRAIIIQFNLSWCYTQHSNDSSRTYIRLETHNRHPMP